MEKLTQEILEKYTKIDPKIFTPTRILLLYLLKFYKDGIQYRELKENLKISDGKLYSNLELLKEIGSINVEKVQIDNKMIEIYTLNDSGKEIIDDISDWIDKLNTMVNKIEK